MLPLLALIPIILAVLPFLRLLAEAVTAPDAVLAVLAAPVTWRAVAHSLEVALGGTVVAGLLGIPFALLTGLTDIRGRAAFTFCLMLPLTIAPQVTALAWMQMAGPSSPILAPLGLAPAGGGRNPLYSAEGIVLLLGLESAPMVFITLRAGLRRMPRELVEAARAGGAGRMAVLRTIILPLMTPPLLAGLALAFVTGLGNFGVPAFLGIPGGYIVLPTLIYQRLAGLGPSALGQVATLSVLAGLLALAGMAAQNRAAAGDFRTRGGGLPIHRLALGQWRLPVEAVLWLFVLAMVVVPILSLIATALLPVIGVALTPVTATLDNYRYVLAGYPAARRALADSLALAATAAALLVGFALPFGHALARAESKRWRWLGLVVELPYAVPGVVLAIALILTYLKSGLYDTLAIILLAYLARFMALGVRPVLSGYRQLDPSLEEAAQVVGARLHQRMISILLPLLAPAAAAGAVLVFLTAFNELTVSALLWSSGHETLGSVVFSLEQSGDVVNAAALASLTVAVTLALMLATLPFARRLPPGVLPWND